MTCQPWICRSRGHRRYGMAYKYSGPQIVVFRLIDFECVFKCLLPVSSSLRQGWGIILIILAVIWWWLLRFEIEAGWILRLLISNTVWLLLILLLAPVVIIAVGSSSVLRHGFSTFPKGLFFPRRVRCDECCQWFCYRKMGTRIDQKKASRLTKTAVVS